MRKLTLESLEARVEERHMENQRRFDEQAEATQAIAVDVKSLLQSRSFTRGIWRAVALIAVSVSSAVSLAFAYFKH